MILVTGATGTVGSEVVRALVDRSQRVRALVRDPEKAARMFADEVELAKGDLADPESLAEAMDDVQRLFLLAPVDERVVELEGKVLDAAKRGGVEHVVRLSVMHADSNADTFFARVHGQAEEQLTRSGLTWTMLRPTFFMQNLLGSAAMIKSGTLYQPAGHGRSGHIDARDIGETAAVALSTRGHEGKSYRLTGPQDLSLHDIVRIIGDVLGKPVAYVDIPRDAAKQSMTGAGMPAWQAEAVLELTDLLKAGELSGVSQDVEQVTGHPARSFEQFVRDHAGAFR
jgi:uncharacterized protein YbjT (DUF2867 family)